MQNLKLQAEGQKQHLAALRDKYNNLVNTIKADIKLNKSEKISELEKLRKAFNKERKDTGTNLY